jgi:hypothetical protein
MGGFEMQCIDSNHRLSLTEIKDLITNNAIPVSSIAITKEEISDRSKTDLLSKLIACPRILWFIIQLTGRAVQHLPTTNLELFTLGIVVCSLGTYAAYWQRPQDIRLPITISVGEGKAFAMFSAHPFHFGEGSLGATPGLELEIYYTIGIFHYSYMETSAAPAGADHHRLQMPWFREASPSSKPVFSIPISLASSLRLE